MRVGAFALLALLLSSSALAQSDDGAAPGAEPRIDKSAQVRNKTTAERISAPNPTTKGVPWTFPLFWDQSLTVRSINEGSQLSYSPNYTWWFTAAPRWIFDEMHSIGAQMTVSIELTDSPAEELDRSGYYNREAFWQDLRLDYLFSVPGRPGGFLFFIAGDLRLPTSRFSRSRERYISPGIRATVSRPISVLSGMQLGVTATEAWMARSAARWSP